MLGVHLAVLVLAASPARAQSQQDIDACNGKNNPPAEQVISSCTSLYQSGKFKAQAVIILNLRGLAYKQSKDYDRAIADFTEALRLDPKNANALNNRGETYIFKKDYRQAYADYDQLTQTAPLDWRGFNGRAVARSRFDPDPAKKIDDLQHANKLAPNHPWPLINLSEVHTKFNETALALEECAKLKQLTNNDPIAFLNCGAAYLKRGDLDPALVEFDAALERRADYSYALYLRGLTKRGKGDEAGAALDIQRAQQLNADVAETMDRNFGFK